MANSSSITGTSSITPIPAAADTVFKNKERIYILHFRQGNQVQIKHFNFTGNLKDAAERAKIHCERMGYRFIFVRPFVVDLDHQESMKNSEEETPL